MRVIVFAVILAFLSTTAHAASPPVVSPLALTPSIWSRLAPSGPQMYGACLDGHRVRLRVRHGTKLEPAQAEAHTDGIAYVMPAGPDGVAPKPALLPWNQVAGVDIWRPGPGFRSATFAGFALGFAIGAVVITQAAKPPHSVAGSAGETLLIGIESLPFGVAGGYVGSRFDSPRTKDGHWADCDSPAQANAR